MSLEVQVFMVPERMPTPNEWQKAIQDRELDLVIDTKFDPATDTGFRPCTYADCPFGFEFYAHSLSNDEIRRPAIPDDHSLCISLITHRGPDWDGRMSAGPVLPDLT